MILVSYGAGVLCFFAILLGSGARLFGASLGSPMRGAVIPLLVIPLAGDWLRFLLKLPLVSAVAAALILYILFAIGFIFLVKPPGPFHAAPASRGKWFLFLAAYLAIHMFMRTWLLTGSVPNPADDGSAGYKANGLIHSTSWPATHPDAPELAMSYYYYAYEWPAAFSSWAGVPLNPGWWATAIVMCVSGAMLILELILPRLNTARDLILGGLAVLNGCGISFLIGIARKLGPKDWIQEQGHISKQFGLYLRVPQAYGAYWDPYIMPATGVLMISIVFLWRLIESRRLSRPETIFIILALASLPGYCTFHLIGVVIIVLPVLTVAAIMIQRGSAPRHWFLPLAAMGAASLLLSSPLVYLFLHRAPAAREARFRDPLYIWLPTAAARFNLEVIAGLAFLALLSTAMSNVLLWPILLRGGREPLPPFTRCLLGLFFFGTFVCYFGIIDDFVPKFGPLVAYTVILAFFTLEKPPKWSYPLMACGVLAPSFLMLNTAHANFSREKQDPLWRTLDRLDAQTHEIVLYDVPLPERNQRVPWQNYAPYFSRIRFLVPADQVDPFGQNYLVDPAQLNSLPPTSARLRALAKGAPTYLLLRTADAPPAGDRLYSSSLFSLDRVKF